MKKRARRWLQRKTGSLWGGQSDCVQQMADRTAVTIRSLYPFGAVFQMVPDKTKKKNFFCRMLPLSPQVACFSRRRPILQPSEHCPHVRPDSLAVFRRILPQQKGWVKRGHHRDFQGRNTLILIGAPHSAKAGYAGISPQQEF